MTPAHFWLVQRAEISKLLSRVSARLGLLLCLGLGVLGPLFHQWMLGSEININGTMVADTLFRGSADFAERALWMRNFLVVKAWIIMLGAQIFAGEFQRRTLREDLLRPVPRWVFVMSKWGALATWSAIGIALLFVSSAVTGGALSLLYDSPEPVTAVMEMQGRTWSQLVTGLFATWLTDVGFAAFVLLASVLFRGVASTILFVFLFYAADWVIGMVLWGLSGFWETAEKVYPWLPSAAFSAYSGYVPELPWHPESFAVLAAITLGSLAVAVLSFQQQDVH